MLNRCPSCHEGKVFGTLIRMNTACPKCGFVFAREPGYFTGAVVASYFMACASLVPTLIVCFFALKLDFWAVVGVALLELIVLSPLFFRYSRLLWILVEHKITRRLEARDRR